MDFISVDMFLTFAGCLGIVALITQVVKTLPGLNKLNPAWCALIVSAFVGTVRICIIGDFTATGIVVGILNIIAIYLGAIGGYETSKQVAQAVVKK